MTVHRSWGKCCAFTGLFLAAARTPHTMHTLCTCPSRASSRVRGGAGEPALVGDDCVTTPVDVAVTGCQVDTSPSDPRRKPHPAPGSSSCRVALTWSEKVTYPIALDPSWPSAASMASARAFHSAIRVPSRQIRARCTPNRHKADKGRPITPWRAADHATAPKARAASALNCLKHPGLLIGAGGTATRLSTATGMLPTHGRVLLSVSARTQRCLADPLRRPVRRNLRCGDPEPIHLDLHVRHPTSGSTDRDRDGSLALSFHALSP